MYLSSDVFLANKHNWGDPTLKGPKLSLNNFDLEVSWNRGTGYPLIIHFIGNFHYKHSTWGYPHLWKPPFRTKNTPSILGRRKTTHFCEIRESWITGCTTLPCFLCKNFCGLWSLNKERTWSCSLIRQKIAMSYRTQTPEFWTPWNWIWSSAHHHSSRDQFDERNVQNPVSSVDRDSSDKDSSDLENPQYILVGGWATTLKNMSSSVGMMKFPIYRKS